MKTLTRLRVFCALLFTILFPLGVFAQSAANVADSAVFKKISAKLADFSTNHKTERAYLHFDKPYYATGDTIWFKAYVTLGERHRLSNLSGLLHVDLIDANNRVTQFIKLKLDNGIAWGDFYLPDTLAKGNYRVRAYTQWMLNGNGNDYFEQQIPITSTKNQKVIVDRSKSTAQFISNSNLPIPSNKPDTKFFPEGGSLVTNIRSKVAFKAIGTDGLGIDVKGVVVDNDNAEVASFASTHLGMGYFYLNPAENKTYKAKLSYPNGVEDVVELPKPDSIGMTIAAADSIKFEAIRVRLSLPFFNKNKDKNCTLVIYSGGVTIATIFKLDRFNFSLNVPKDKLFSGITRVTLFSPTGEPLSERLFFVQNNDGLKLQANADKSQYAKREKVNLHLNATDKDGDAVQGHFSVAVIDQSKVPANENAASTIYTNLLLTSDLGGYVEQPNYYFANAKASGDLDLVMLTHGYRRFEWKELLTTGYPVTWQPENSVEINGSATTAAGKPLANGNITLASFRNNVFLSQTTDAQGRFKFSNLAFADTIHFVLNAMNEKGKADTKLTYNLEKPAPVVKYGSVFKDTLTTYLENRKKIQIDDAKYGTSKNIILKEVKINDVSSKDEYYSSGLAGSGHADKVLHAADLENLGDNLADVLAAKLNGVTFRGLTSIPYLNTAQYANRVLPMLVVMDGINLPVGSGVSYIQPQDVETVELLKYTSTSIYGARGAGGVLIITTKAGAGTLDKYVSAPNILPIVVNGFYKARAFYVPKYDHPQTTHRDDLRSTIYWNPQLITDKGGNAFATYTNADGSGNYLVVIEGIDSNGNIGRTTYTYKVQ